PDMVDERSGRLTIVDAWGRSVMDVPMEGEVLLPLTQIEEGTYRLIGHLLRKDGGVVEAERGLVIHRIREGREVKIDGLTNAMLVDGMPFFPIGIYWVRETFITELTGMAFNTGDYYPWLREEEIASLVDRAGEERLGILLEFSDLLRPAGFFDKDHVRKRVERYRHHPGLLAWYLIDEPGETQTSVEETRAAYEYIKELDPTHPVYLVNNRPETYIDHALSTDILAIDPYPIPNRSPEAVADAVDLALAAVRGRKPVWVIIQAFGATEWWARAPTPVEERCMVYLALIHGAGGILFYRYCTGEERNIQSEALWKEVVQLAGELRTLGPILLTGTEATGVRVKQEGRGIDVLAKWFEDDLYLFAANRSDRSSEVEFVLEPNPHTGGRGMRNNHESVHWGYGGQQVHGVTLYGGERRFRVKDGVFKDVFETYGVKVYRLRKERV
ncbi:MAG: beta-galactosidase, partial [Candidatus Latescibacteria bacterium]|nr:beta-galactosidase [Candidatus Latescibacterota bacterium]